MSDVDFVQLLVKSILRAWQRLAILYFRLALR